MNPVIYLGGSISGIPFEYVLAQREKWIEILEGLGFTVVDPIADENIILDAEGCANFPVMKGGKKVTPEETARMDLVQLSECNVALFLLHPSVISRGSISEQGYCYGIGLDTYVLRDEDSVHDHGFVNGLATLVTHDRTTLVRGLTSWLLEWEEKQLCLT